MSNMTDYLEGQLANHLFRTASMVKPAVIALALFTTAPSDAGGGTEVAGSNYTRVALNPLDANWSAPTAGNGITSNSVAATFPVPSATWGTVTHFAIFDALSAGNMLFWGVLAVAKTINNGDTVPFPANGITVTFA